ncbi:MAG: hypothetical protein LAT81_09865 [Oceanicaulis sp.]|nr:hypothetical protein [Oceanicaulis sp.]
MVLHHTVKTIEAFCNYFFYPIADELLRHVFKSVSNSLQMKGALSECSRIFSAYPPCGPVFQLLLALSSLTPYSKHVIINLKFKNMSYTKTFIGKGEKIEQLQNAISMAICIDDVEPFIFEYGGKRYIKFEVHELKQKTQFGKTHTAFISHREVAPEVVAEPKPKRTRKPKKA